MQNEILAEKIKMGDQQAYEKLFHKYYVSLCQFSYKFLRDADQAEEVVQATFVKIWQRRDSISVHHSLKSYLFQSVRNSCLNEIKHSAVVRDHNEYTLATVRDSDDSDTLVTNELAEKIRIAVGSLPEERQRIFKMSRDEGMKYSEIATELNISIKTVENQIGRALKYLRVELSDFLIVFWIIYFSNY